MNHPILGIIVLLGISFGLAWIGWQGVKEFKKRYDDK